ncbi:MAG: Na+/H+ antiporter NhaA [Thermoleophilia bacterium]
MPDPGPPQDTTQGIRPPWSRTDRAVPRRVLRPVQQFMRLEASGGIVLLLASIAALVWANVATGSYEDFWSTDLTITLGDSTFTEDLMHVVNDGLMVIFFLVVGLEVKRELTVGELSTRQAALLPFFAAVGGMVLPALIYLGVMAGEPGSAGWGIPMATDVAFALAALAALGSRVPTSLVAFLLGVAVIDDIGAILVVAVYYTDTITLGWLALALGALALMALAARLQVRFLGVYVVLGLLAWFATLESGVHATIAGVAIGLLTPVRPFQDPAAVSAEAVRIAEATDDHPEDPDADAGQWRRLSWLAREAVSPLTRVEHGLHLWSSFLVLPLFALANAGIVLDSGSIDAATETPVTLAVVLGLVVGKTFGLTLGALVAVRLGLSALPAGVTWRHMLGVGGLAGIGFTVSLFITELAFDDPDTVAAAKLGILVGSIAAAVIGLTLLALAARRRPGPGVSP